MKSTLLFLSFVFALFITDNALAQVGETKIEWGPEYKHRGFYQIIGKYNTDLYVFHSGLSLSRKKPNFKIFRFNEENKLEKEFKIYDIIKSTMQVIDVSVDESGLNLLVFNVKDKKAQKIEQLVIDPESQKITNTQTIHSFKEEYVLDAIGMQGFFSDPKRLINYIKSDDNTKIALVIKNLDKKSTTIDYLILDKNAGFKKINELDLVFKPKLNFEKVVSTDLNGDGSIAVLTKVYNGSSEKEKKSNKPNYKHYLTKKRLGSEAVEIKLGSPANFLKGSLISMDDDGTVYVASLYEESYNRGAGGTQLYKVSPTNEIVFKRSNVSSGLAKGKSKLSKDYEINYFLNTGDFYVIAYQERKISENTRMGRNNRPTAAGLEYKYGDIIVERFNADGDLVWNEKIYCNKQQQGYPFNIVPQIFYNNEQISMFVNYNKKNLKEGSINIEKQKKANFPGKDNIVTKIVIDTNGELRFDQLSEPGDQNIITGGIRYLDDKYYILGINPKGSAVQLGVSSGI